MSTATKHKRLVGRVRIEEYTSAATVITDADAAKLEAVVVAAKEMRAELRCRRTDRQDPSVCVAAEAALLAAIEADKAAAVDHAVDVGESFKRECDRLRDRAEAAEARLPVGMKHCTITFSKCEKGHGELSATNWKPYTCSTCRIEKAEAERDEARNYAAEIAQGVCHYPHDENEPCVRCERDEARAKLAAKSGVVVDYEAGSRGCDCCGDTHEGECHASPAPIDVEKLQREIFRAFVVAEDIDIKCKREVAAIAARVAKAFVEGK